MTKPDWEHAWQLLEKYKEALEPEIRIAQHKLLDAIADLLNKQEVSGIILFHELLVQKSILEFHRRYTDKVFAYRDWFEDRVELKDEFFTDVDRAYRDAFDEKYDLDQI